MSPADTDLWFSRPQRQAHPRLRLFCFPHAGAGSMIFRRWAAALPAGCELCLAELPGRGMRLKEPPYTRLVPLAAALAERMVPYLDRPFILFGHSMGALLSFEIARILRRRGLSAPEHIVVSAREAPHLPEARKQMHLLPDTEFVGELERMNGTPVEVLQNAELMELMLPVLRADFAVCETYTCEPEPPLDCPITALAGSRDAHVQPQGITKWQEQTRGGFTLRMVDGDHFFLQTAEAAVLRVVNGIIARAIEFDVKRNEIRMYGS